MYNHSKTLASTVECSHCVSPVLITMFSDWKDSCYVIHLLSNSMKFIFVWLNSFLSLPLLPLTFLFSSVTVLTLDPSPFNLHSRHSSPISSSKQLSRPKRLPRVQRLSQHRGRVPADPSPLNETQHDPTRPSTPPAQPSGLDGRSSGQWRLQ